MPKERRTVFALNARKVNRAFYDKVQEYFDNNKDDRLEQFSQNMSEDDRSDGQGFPERVVERLYPVHLKPTWSVAWRSKEQKLEVPRIISPCQERISASSISEVCSPSMEFKNHWKNGLSGIALVRTSLSYSRSTFQNPTKTRP